MSDCCSLPVDENGFLIEIPEEEAPILARAKNTCPTCTWKGKSVDGATVKSMLSVSLNQIKKMPRISSARIATVLQSTFLKMVCRRLIWIKFENACIKKNLRRMMFPYAIVFNILLAMFLMPPPKIIPPFWTTSMQELKRGIVPVIYGTHKAHAALGMCAVSSNERKFQPPYQHKRDLS